MPRLTNENKLIQQIGLRLLFDCNCISTAYETPWSDINSAFTLTSCRSKVSYANAEEAAPQLKALLNKVFAKSNALTFYKSKFGLWLSKQFNLSQLEYEVLFVVCLIATYKPLTEMVDSLGELTDAKTYQILSDITQYSAKDIAKALNKNQKLANNNLVNFSGGYIEFTKKIQPTEIIESQFSNPYFNSHDITSSSLTRVEEPQLSLKTYNRRNSRDIQFILKLLKAFKQASFFGCNILIYGEPGTGKTQLSRILASEAKLSCFEVNFANQHGEQLSGKNRLAKLAQARTFIDQENSVIVFDELEDAIPHNDPFSSYQGPQKRWFNNLLETAPSPVIWISNEIDQIDPAFMRRFDYCLKLTPPSKQYKTTLIQKLLDINEDAKWVESVAAHNTVTVADIERATFVIQATKTDSEKQKAHYLNNLLATRGEKLKGVVSRKQSNASYQFETTFQPELSNTSMPLVEIEAIVKSANEGRFLLHGVPGTGKTGFAHYLANKLDVPIVSKSGVDLLGMFIGENEKAIRNMFAEAKRKNAILLLDEADNFFSDRSNHNSEWRTSLVNEMLVQLERFQGVFFASTNLPDSLDTAIKRRFDFTVSFNYLKSEQIKKLAQSILSANDTISNDALNTLGSITPADFALAARQSRLKSKPLNSNELTTLLLEQSAMRRHNKQKLGFI